MLRAVLLAGISAALLTSAPAASAASGLASRPDDTASANGRVAAIVRGETVYVGGHYHRAAGATREHLAAFNAATGALDPCNPGANSVNGIYAVVVTSSRLYAGGEFTVIGGVSQPRFAQFSGSP